MIALANICTGKICRIYRNETAGNWYKQYTHTEPSNLIVNNHVNIMFFLMEMTVHANWNVSLEIFIKTIKYKGLEKL